MQEFLELCEVLWQIKMIPRKMKLDAAAGKLRIQIHQAQQIIRANEHMHGRTHIGEGCGRIELVKEAAATRHVLEMLCFMNNEGARVAMMETFLQNTTQIKRCRGSFNDQLPLPIPAHATHVIGDLVGEHGLVSSNESTSKVVFPTKVARIRGCCFHEYCRNMSRCGCWIKGRILDQLFDQALQQRRLANASWTHGPDGGSACRAANSVQECFIHLLEVLISDH